MTVRNILAAVLGVGILGTVVAAQQVSSESPKIEVLPSTPRMTLGAPPSRTLAGDLLFKRIDRVEWSDITFEEVLEGLLEQSEDRVNIIPKWRALNAIGVDGERAVTLQLRNTTVAEILAETLDQLAEEGLVRFRAEDNNLRISTRDDFGSKMVVRVYNITDIIFHLPDFGKDAPTIDLDAASRSGGGGGGGGGGQSVFGGGSSGGTEELEEEEDEVEERIEELREIIMQTIDPLSWGGEGGAGGRGIVASYNDRALVVYNTVEVHEQIAGYFTQN